MNFLTMGLKSSWLKSLGLKSPGLESSWLKNLGLKGLGLKLGVEKSGVEMSFNQSSLLVGIKGISFHSDDNLVEYGGFIKYLAPFVLPDYAILECACLGTNKSSPTASTLELHLDDLWAP